MVVTIHPNKTADEFGPAPQHEQNNDLDQYTKIEEWGLKLDADGWMLMEKMIVHSHQTQNKVKRDPSTVCSFIVYNAVTPYFDA
jgi:hypothetical protein